MLPTGPKAELALRVLEHCGLDHPVTMTRVPHQVIVFAKELHGSHADMDNIFNELTKQMAQLGDRFCRQLLGSPTGFVPYWHVYDRETRVKLQSHFGTVSAMQARLKHLQHAHVGSKVKEES